MGDSLGGQVSVFVGLKRPHQFKKVGAQSGAFWDGPSSIGAVGCQIIEQFRAADSSLDLTLFFTAGFYEGSVWEDTEKLVAIAKENNWKVNAMYLYEGHSWGQWRHTLNDMLEFLLND